MGSACSASPSVGIGIDFSEEMTRRASSKHLELNFLTTDAHDLSILNGKFDFIILSDTINDLWDVQEVFQQIYPLCERNTRLILNLHSYLWRRQFAWRRNSDWQFLHWNRTGWCGEDIANFLRLTGFEPVRAWQEFLEPFPFHGWKV